MNLIDVEGKSRDLTSGIVPVLAFQFKKCEKPQSQQQLFQSRFEHVSL
jgi:hypothetical protein